ncbi:hypothetical protein Y032_0002g543 [Ancylostoma ceylanicum]|nr:hypothetical protein Y032_0002g543 [Ancylostoma ceylanicum]
MFQAIREATLREGADDSDGSLGLTDLATVGRDFFSGISRFFSTKFDDEDRRIIANGIREFFNVTTPGVFTGLGLLGIAEEVEPRGLIIALEHPSLVQYWEEVGLKLTKMNGHAHTSRIQLKSSEPIEKALPKLAANEPNNFDFIFLDDFKRDNYLDDYEHSIRLLRRGGLLIINQALNNGGVLTDAELMTENDRVMSSMNVRIREDGRVCLPSPFHKASICRGGGKFPAWTAYKLAAAEIQYNTI